MNWTIVGISSLLLSLAAGDPAPPPPAATGAPVTPAAVRLPAPPRGTPFAALLATPQTLVYETDGIAVACHVEDAGVAGSDVDFRVTCDPGASATADARWTCTREGYLEVEESRPVFLLWQSTGCYAVRADGLWYFPTCPGTAEGIERPDPSARLELPTDLAAWVTGGEDDPPMRTRLVKKVLRYKRGRTRTLCRGEADAGMMKSVEAAWCASPDLGWVASASLYVEPTSPDEGRVKKCRDRCTLVAVKRGLAPWAARPPAAPPAAPDGGE